MTIDFWLAVAVNVSVMLAVVDERAVRKEYEGVDALDDTGAIYTAIARSGNVSLNRS